MDLKNPVLNIDISKGKTEELQCLKDGFEELNPEEKFDVVELQSIMLQKIHNRREMYGLPESRQKAERDASEIISHMSPRSLDYSQNCINYYISKIASAVKK
ncbi:hypothetical protein [Methanolobus halotolerans]|uniref:Uncharacterized protein n=1 Tax=Methanolobus halotolerans TaxID=2052935 RepID=A0A4E0Q7N9_9EURY|nr:hypothetical protein [Methanolobus halotolerans]TGC07241.1 hypothetical protein CUN85_11885 [Methanolobus halotolerans]